VGFEPTTPGLQNRRQDYINSAKTKAYKGNQSELTPQLTPEGRKAVEMDTWTLPPDVAAIVAVWPSLPEHIKAAITALIDTSQDGKGPDET